MLFMQSVVDSANLIYYYKPFGSQEKGRFPVIQKNQLKFFHELLNKKALDVVLFVNGV